MGPELIEGRNLRGEPASWMIDFDGVAFDTALSDVRRGAFASASSFAYGVVHKAAKPVPEATDRLAHEITIGTILSERFAARAYPNELAKLLGFHAEGQEPFLLASSRGNRLPDVRLPLAEEELQTFAGSLFTGLRLLELAGVVHGDLSPGNVLWDGRHAQLIDFSHATERYRQRQPAGTWPWTPPEQERGIGLADPRDDVYSAALLVLHVATGERIQGVEHAHKLLETVGEPLGRALRGALETVEERPDALTVLHRLGHPDPWGEGTRVAGDRRFEEGLAAFEELRERKRMARERAEQVQQRTRVAMLALAGLIIMTVLLLRMGGAA